MSNMESVYAFICIVIIVAIIASKIKKQPTRRDVTELQVEKELERILRRRGYVVFGDLIIPSVSDSIKSTQIDHVIISLYGIFCIETKSHKGNIYGGFSRKYWKQYLGNKSYELYSPVRQNTHHVKSLEYLLRSRLKAPIHSYIVFPFARHIKIDGRVIDFSLDNTVDRILRHRRQVYTIEDVEAMAKGLAYVMSKSSDFMDDHIEAVREYVSSRNR